MGVFSAIFRPWQCSLCGKRVGVISGFKLKDGAWLCGDCGNKCSPDLVVSDYARMTLENMQEGMELHRQRAERYKTEFVTNAVFHQAGGMELDLLAVDEEHGLWANLRNDEPEAFPIGAVTKHALIFKTKEDSKSEDQESSMGGLLEFAMKAASGSPELTRADFPRIPSEEVREMNLWFYVNVPYLRRVKIPLIDGLYPKRYEIEEGYLRADEILRYLEELYNRMYPDNVANNPFDSRSLLKENAMEGLDRLNEILGRKK